MTLTLLLMCRIGETLHGASASVMATEDRTTEAVAKKATTNDLANASFYFM